MRKERSENLILPGHIEGKDKARQMMTYVEGLNKWMTDPNFGRDINK